MTSTETPPAETHAPADVRPRGVSRRSWRRIITGARVGDWVLEGLALALMIAVAVGFATYAGRRVLVGEMAEEYLRRRGVEAEVQVMDVDARGFIGRVRLGPAADPDFTAERVEVLLAAPPPPEGPYALRPRSILIRRPQLKLRWTGETVSFGALDPLIEEALNRPPQDDQPGPRVQVEDGFVRLFTPYGLVRAGGAAVVDDSSLESLDLQLRPASLRGETFAAEVRGGRARVRVAGEAAEVALDLALGELVSRAGELDGAVLRVAGGAPYPDIKNRRVDGPVQLNVGLRAARAETGATALSDAELNLALRGELAGGANRAVYRGGADAVMRADRLTADGAGARELRAEAGLSSAVLEWADGALAGRAGLRTIVSAGSAEAADARAEAPRLTAVSRAMTFDTGDGSVSGPLGFTLAAARLDARGASAQGLRAQGTSTAAALRSTGAGMRVSGPLSGRVRADRVALDGQGSAAGLDAVVTTELRLLGGSAAPLRGALQAERVRLAAAEPLSISNALARFEGSAGGGGFDLRSDLRADAALPAANARRIAAELPVVGDSPAYAAAIGRALTGFSVTAPGVRLAGNGAAARATFAQPLDVRSPGGARLAVTPVNGPVALGGEGFKGGGVRLAVSGGGLPAAEATVGALDVRPSGISADLRLRAALDIPLAEGAVVEARGRAVSRRGAFSFIAADCARVSAARVELGENDVQAAAAQLCPLPGAPVVQAGPGGYRIRARFVDAAAEVPFLQTKLSAGAGALDASGGPAGLADVAVRIDTAEAADTAPERRFHPVAITGTAALEAGDWRARLDVLDAPAGTRIALADLAHDTASGAGGVDITAEGLRFTPEGLQPHDLTPLAAGAVSQVEGAVDFTGRIAWTDGALPVSSGRAATQGLSFDGPAGRVTGLAGSIGFNSLTPLTAPPGQVLTAERVDAFTPLSDIRAEFALAPDAVQLGSAAFAMAGGRVEVEPMRLPFAEPRTLSGAVRLRGVDLGSIVAATGFADKVKLQAVVDGRIPFQIGPEGVRIAGGALNSVRPGRLSIAREALTQVSASGAPEAVAGADGAPVAAPPPNAFQDWAYQALENLAYNELEVSVNSQPGGRLGMEFVIKGRHDPPTPQQARIGILDLLRGQAFQRKIPLPSDTPVNLTLDTSLNFDELLATWLELQRERSAPVQSAPAT